MVSHQQDPFLKNKQRKLFASRIWPPEFDDKVDMSRVSIEVLRPWIEKRVSELLGGEDEIVSEYCVAQLESYDPVDRTIEPREVQINLEGFLGEPQAAVFMRELWNLIKSAQLDPSGIPSELREEKERMEAEAKKQAELMRIDMSKKYDQEREPRRDGRDRRERRPSPRRTGRHLSPARDRGAPRVERRRRSPSPIRDKEVSRATRHKRTPSPSPERDVRPRVERRKRTPSPVKRAASPSPARVERRKRTPSPSPARGRDGLRSPSRSRSDDKRQPRRKRTPSPSPARESRRYRR